MGTQGWYKRSYKRDLLSQGDIIYSCFVAFPQIQKKGAKPEPIMRKQDVIVMSQTCDLVNEPPPELVAVCPIYSLCVSGVGNQRLGTYFNIEQLRRNILPDYHLLDACRFKKHTTDWLVVDFSKVHMVPFEYLKVLVESNRKITLRSPFRERMSQAFAEFFMRIGLEKEVEITKFDKKEWQERVAGETTQVLNKSVENLYKPLDPFRLLTSASIYREYAAKLERVIPQTFDTEHHNIKVKIFCTEPETLEKHLPKHFATSIKEKEEQGYEAEINEPGNWLGYKEKGDYFSPHVWIRICSPSANQNMYPWIQEMDWVQIIEDETN